MNTLTKEQAIKIVIDCADKYSSNLLDKSLLFVTMDKTKTIHTVETCFFKRNYLHLTGLIVDNNQITASRFFEMCISRKLSPNDFRFRDDGTTILKLYVLPVLMTKNLTANSIGEYNGVGLELYTEKIAGSVRGCMGFRTDKITKKLVPNTILNKDIRQCTKIPQERIIATFRKNISDEKYSEIVYSAKKIEWENIKFPGNYTYLYGLIKQ